ncbi:MAG: gamma carbonic anhydrase family protein [Clostridia bacterium]|nr:gamma carbonic anhydrase family protein [Clostridia bacterium]
MIKAFKDKTPDIHESCFVASNAVVIGEVTLEKDANVWFSAVIRGDSENITIGEGSNVQDCAVLHCDHGFPLTVGKNVTVGHSAVVHGCNLGDNVMIGMHATLLNGCIIGEGSIIGAGALVREGQVIPPNSLVVGVPAKVVRETSAEQVEGIINNAQHYVEIAKEYKEAAL